MDGGEIVEIRPGDKVLLPGANPGTAGALERAFPGVAFRISDSIRIDHALVYRNQAAARTESQVLREVHAEVARALAALSGSGLTQDRVQHARQVLLSLADGVDAVLNGGDRP